MKTQVPLIECVGLEKKFGTESKPLTVLSDLNFAIGSHESVSIMGRSGGGKSTLLGCLSGLEEPTRGSVKWNGVDVRTYPDSAASDLNRARAELMGIIFQQFHLIEHLTAAENARLSLDLKGTPNKESDPIVREALAQVGLADRANHFPHELSRGECQRVAIARVLVMKPKVILADEPTGSLDEATGESVMKLIFDLADTHKMSLLLVTHDPELAKRCSRQFRLVDGRLTESRGANA
jgi:putative ABC transport system ATP-binding protein